MIPSKNNIRRTKRYVQHRERDASHLNEATKIALNDAILAVGGDDSAIYVPFVKAEKAIDALRRNFGHREIVSEDVAVYNAADDSMARLVKISLSAIEAEQIQDGINKKVILNAAVITHGSAEQDQQALGNELARRGSAHLG